MLPISIIVSSDAADFYHFYHSWELLTWTTSYIVIFCNKLGGKSPHWVGLNAAKCCLFLSLISSDAAYFYHFYHSCLEDSPQEHFKSHIAIPIRDFLNSICSQCCINVYIFYLPIDRMDYTTRQIIFV